jgi:hypothetical protein
MDLCLASHRAILKALQAFEDGELAHAVNGLVTVTTPEGDVRFLDGVCFAAPRKDWLGADLVGWLEELERLSGVGAWWRPGLRAVLRLRDGGFALTAASQDLSIGGLPAASGFATHSARFLVAQGEIESAPPQPAPADAVSSGVRPVAVRTAPARPAPLPAPLPAPRPHRPPVPVAAESAESLRARGEWRTTAVVPWTLGEGRRPPRLTEPEFGPLPRVLPPPVKRMEYTTANAGVHTLPKAPPPPRRDAMSPDESFSHVA